MHTRQQPFDLCPGKHGGEAAWLTGAHGDERGIEFDAEHFAVQEEQGAEGLVWVAAATFRSTARWLRKASMCCGPRLRGCCL